MARPFRIDFGCTMTEIARRGEASLLLGRQDGQGIGEGKFKIQGLTPHSPTAYCCVFRNNRIGFAQRFAYLK